MSQAPRRVGQASPTVYRAEPAAPTLAKLLPSNRKRGVL